MGSTPIRDDPSADPSGLRRRAPPGGPVAPGIRSRLRLLLDGERLRQAASGEGGDLDLRHGRAMAPHDNAAERASRHGGIGRKNSGVTDAERWGRFVERLLSMVATCRLKGHGMPRFLNDGPRSGLEAGPNPCRSAEYDARSRPFTVTPPANGDLRRPCRSVNNIKYYNTLAFR